MAKRKLFNKKGRTPYKSINARTKEAKVVRESIETLYDLLNSDSDYTYDQRKSITDLADYLKDMRSKGYRTVMIDDVLNNLKEKNIVPAGKSAHDRFNDIISRLPEDKANELRKDANSKKGQSIGYEIFEIGDLIDDGMEPEVAYEEVVRQLKEALEKNKEDMMAKTPEERAQLAIKRARGSSPEDNLETH